VQIWEPKSEEPLLIYQGHAGPVNAIAWSPDGKYIVSGSSNNGYRRDPSPLQVWNAVNGHTIRFYQGYDYLSFLGVTAVAWSPDGSMIASGGFDATVQVWKAL
jgi:WD40 repeat protein